MNRKIKVLLLIPLSIFLITVKVEEAKSQPSRCTVQATTVNFGNYDIFLNIPLDSTGSITVSCTANVPRATLTLGTSPNSGSFNPRKMRRSGGTDLLNYNIFTDASRTTIFGNGNSGTSDIRIERPDFGGKPQLWSWTITVYGRIPPGQDVSVGNYTDILTVTVDP
ncbi:MAG: Csu type fimbrial protein [Thermodesulfobacteriota bacterium]